jgi:hypothetical protein
VASGLVVHATLTCRDINDVEQKVEVSAKTCKKLFGLGFCAFWNADRVRRVGPGQTTITVMAKQPEVEHKLRVRDFARGLNRIAAHGPKRP